MNTTDSDEILKIFGALICSKFNAIGWHRKKKIHVHPHRFTACYSMSRLEQDDGIDKTASLVVEDIQRNLEMSPRVHTKRYILMIRLSGDSDINITVMLEKEKLF